mgnify:CR=1 FL=1
MSNGQYSKGSRRITDAKVKVPTGLPAAPKMEPQVQQTVERLAMSKAEQTIRMLDKGRLVVRKETGWLLAAIIVLILGTGAYLAAAFFTSQMTVQRLQSQAVEMSKKIENEKARADALERRLVELETRFELEHPALEDED